MRILMLTPYLPYPLLSGGQVRTYNLLRHISKEHDVTLFALIKDESERNYLSELAPYCRDIQVFKRTASPWHPSNVVRALLSPYPFVVTRNLVPQVKTAIAEELAREHYDLIHVETFYMMPSIPETTLPIILVEQTIEHLGYESFAKKLQQKWPLLLPILKNDIRKIRLLEREYWTSCQQLVAVSEEDRSLMKKTVPDLKKISVVANGIDSEYFDEVKPKPAKDPTILFVGTFKWLPNVDAVHYLVEEVWPLLKKQVPNIRLRIAGADPTEDILKMGRTDKNITVTGRVPDIRDEYAQSHVLIAPILSGKGTRYKVLEAMACGTPVVGTSLAFEGINAQAEKHCLIGDTPNDLATLALRILQSQELAQRLSSSASQFVRKHFDWNTIAKDLLTIYAKTAHE